MRHAGAVHGHRETRSLASHALSLAHRAWRTYWARKAEQTTVLILRSLDDRTLKDIGIDRSEIEFGGLHRDPRAPQRLVPLTGTPYSHVRLGSPSSPRRRPTSHIRPSMPSTAFLFACSSPDLPCLGALMP